jgi:hypothetical protein
MATEGQILTLRQMVNEDDECGGWDDEKLAAAIDGTDTLNAAAAQVWYLKAGQYASLVDVSESGSSRKLSDLRKNATEMGELYAGIDAGAIDTTTGPVIQRIRRTVA